MKHGGGAGEARGLGTLVEPVRQVDEEDHREREQTEGRDQEAEPLRFPAQRQRSEDHRQDADGDQQVGVGGTGRARFDGGSGGGHVAEAGVAGLADLHRAVINELGGDEEGAGGNQDRGCRSPRGDHRAGGGRHSRQ